MWLELLHIDNLFSLAYTELAAAQNDRLNVLWTKRFLIATWPAASRGKNEQAVYTAQDLLTGRICPVSPVYADGKRLLPLPPYLRDSERRGYSASDHSDQWTGFASEVDNLIIHQQRFTKGGGCCGTHHFDWTNDFAWTLYYDEP